MPYAGTWQFTEIYRPLPASRLLSVDQRKAVDLQLHSERGDALFHEVTAHTAVHARRREAVAVVQLAAVAAVAARAHTVVRERALEARACAIEIALVRPLSLTFLKTLV